MSFRRWDEFGMRKWLVVIILVPMIALVLGWMLRRMT